MRPRENFKRVSHGFSSNHALSFQLLNAGCRKAMDTQRYAMNKVIYALLRGWP